MVTESVAVARAFKEAARRHRWRAGNAGEAAAALFMMRHGLTPLDVMEQFHIGPFRLDFAFPEQEIGIELQGGTWVNGGHNRGAQMSKDYEKLNSAQACGWKVFQFSTDMLRNDPRACAEIVGNEVELRDKF